MSVQAKENSSQLEAIEGERTAILVIHGMGQQQPFQPLDLFVRGLREGLNQAVKKDGKSVETTHFKPGREEVFDHFMRLEVKDQAKIADRRRTLDVYELYWAPMTQGRATFAQILSWFRTTVLTPVNRFAFNLPLTLQKDDKLNLTTLRYLRELWRTIWVPLVGLLIVVLVGILAKHSADLLKKLTPAIYAAIPTYQKWSDVFFDTAIAILVLGMVLAFIAILRSVPQQTRDFGDLRNLKPGLPNPLTLGTEAYRMTKGSLFQRARASFSAVRTAIGQAFMQMHRWETEVTVRKGFLWLSIFSIPVLGFLLYWICSDWPTLTQLVAGVRKELGLTTVVNLISTVLLVLLGWLMKVIFVDYLGDVALYVTADETSTFYRTRSEILEKATEKLRYLLRNYSHVALAGHSLGSVIAYDTINRLRMETQLTSKSRSSMSTRYVLAVIDQISQLPGGKFKEGLAETVARLQESLKEGAGDYKTPLTSEEFDRLKVFITFGSPLDKVWYFFRQRVKSDEKVRAHILYELHGFRRISDLLTTDRTIHDKGSLPEDNVRWLNFYSLMDPISAKLSFYERVHNQRLKYRVPGLSHTRYWNDPRFYHAVINVLERTDSSGVVKA